VTGAGLYPGGGAMVFGTVGWPEFGPCENFFEEPLFFQPEDDCC